MDASCLLWVAHAIMWLIDLVPPCTVASKVCSKWQSSSSSPPRLVCHMMIEEVWRAREERLLIRKSRGALCVCCRRLKTFLVFAPQKCPKSEREKRRQKWVAPCKGRLNGESVSFALPWDVISQEPELDGASSLQQPDLPVCHGSQRALFQHHGISDSKFETFGLDPQVTKGKRKGTRNFVAVWIRGQNFGHILRLNRGIRRRRRMTLAGQSRFVQYGVAWVRLDSFPGSTNFCLLAPSDEQWHNHKAQAAPLKLLPSFVLFAQISRAEWIPLTLTGEKNEVWGWAEVIFSRPPVPSPIVLNISELLVGYESWKLPPS